MKQEIIDLIIECRTFIGIHTNSTEKCEHPDKMKKSVDDTMAGIASAVEKYNKKTGENLAFNNLQEYAAFDRQKCKEICDEYHPLKKEYIKCNVENPPCQDIYKAKACALKTAPVLNDEILWAFFGRIKTGLPPLCPGGYGWQRDTANWKDFPLDITWEVFK